MRILFDHGTAAPLQSFFTDHSVHKAKDLSWDTLSNGELLKAAEETGFHVLLTTDKNIRFQQNLSKFSIAIVVLGDPTWPMASQYIRKRLRSSDIRKTRHLLRSGYSGTMKDGWNGQRPA